MKKYLIIFTLSFLTSTSFAQKCKETTDPITNEKKIEFANEDQWFNIKYQIKGANIILIQPIYFSDVVNATLKSGTVFYYKLKNGEILKLPLSEECPPKLFNGIIGTASGYNCTFRLTKDDLVKLANSPLIFIRVPTDTEKFIDLNEKDINVEKSKKILIKGASCIKDFTY